MNREGWIDPLGIFPRWATYCCHEVVVLGMEHHEHKLYFLVESFFTGEIERIHATNLRFQPPIGKEKNAQ